MTLSGQRMSPDRVRLRGNERGKLSRNRGYRIIGVHEPIGDVSG
jgi:hypothetical protein